LLRICQVEGTPLQVGRLGATFPLNSARTSSKTETLNCLAGLGIEGNFRAAAKNIMPLLGEMDNPRAAVGTARAWL